MDFHIEGDALKLLEDFIRYATQPNTSQGVADAMYYDPDALLQRAKQLQRQTGL